MKTRLQLLLLFSVLFFSSCETSNKLVLKRRYNAGYYVDFGNKKNSKDSEINANKNSTSLDIKNNFRVDDEIEFSEDQTINAPLMASKDNTIQLPSKNKLSLFQPHKSNNASSFQKNNLKSEKSKIKLVSKINKKTDKSTSKNSDIDANLILLVILSLFPILSLIAIYIHDQKIITFNFWIDLILHFTFIGYAIFAVLVVLDIINLG